MSDSERVCVYVCCCWWNCCVKLIQFHIKKEIKFKCWAATMHIENHSNPWNYLNNLILYLYMCFSLLLSLSLYPPSSFTHPHTVHAFFYSRCLMKYSCAEINKVFRKLYDVYPYTCRRRAIQTQTQRATSRESKRQPTSELILTKWYDDGHIELLAVSA